LNWLVEQCFRNEGYWVIASLLSFSIFMFDERSWYGISTNGFKFELQRYRTRIVALAGICIALSLYASINQGLLSRLCVTAMSITTFHLFQKFAFDFSGIRISGASKRIVLGVSVAMIFIALLPIVNATFIPVVFTAAGAVTSLSSRNHLFFRLSQETLALRRRLSSDLANRHNRHLFIPVSDQIHSSDDIASKAG